MPPYPMPDAFSITVHHGPYILLVAKGRANLADLHGLIELAATVTQEAHSSRALVDMMSVEFRHGDAEDRELGSHAARSLRHLSRVAFAVCSNFRQQSGARVAQDAGVELQTFDNLVHASEWISGGPFEAPKSRQS